MRWVGVDSLEMNSARVKGMVIEEIKTNAYRIMTDRPEADGTFEWDNTVLITVEISCGNIKGFGYTYGDQAVSLYIESQFYSLLKGQNVFAISALWERMNRLARNDGQSGIAGLAISAVDIALWDLKGRLLEISLIDLWGKQRDRVPVYGSGGFLTYSFEDIRTQCREWKAQGISRFKIKIGENIHDDLKRAEAARVEIGPESELFVDANGAYSEKEALQLASRLAELDVRWFEEPVTSDDVQGLCRLRERLPAGMSVAAGEYGFRAADFMKLLEAHAVDVLQIDVTRCGGFTGFLNAAVLAEAFHIPISGHTAPSLHAHLGAVLPNLQHVEYFHDHVRIENHFMKDVPVLTNGELVVNENLPGHGITLKHEVLEPFRMVRNPNARNGS